MFLTLQLDLQICLDLVWGRLHLLMSKDTSHQTLNTTQISLGELVICLGLIENLAP